jgi:hypothetical protein
LDVVNLGSQGFDVVIVIAGRLEVSVSENMPVVEEVL